MHGTEEVDVDSLVARCMGSRSFAAKLLSKLPLHAGVLMEQIDHAVRTSDAPRLKQAAHGLKGIAANLSAEHVRVTALRLERLAESSRAIVTDAAPILAELREHVMRCNTALPAILSRLAA